LLYAVIFYIYSQPDNQERMRIHLLLAAIPLLLISCRKDTIVNTTSVREVTATSAQTGGYVEGSRKNKVIERGVCWSKSPNAGYQASTSNYTKNGYGFGEYSSFISGLQSGTTYFARAYARTEAGYYYGNEVSFKTLVPPDPSLIVVNGISYQVNTYDEYSINWGQMGVSTGATSNTDGDYNTTMMLSNYSYGAAAACANLVSNGYSDWFLPSKDQLNAMYQKRSYYGLQSAYYWSSTEFSMDVAWLQHMGTGVQTNAYKNNYYNCRCIRKK
jgi:hypothetical protein